MAHTLIVTAFGSPGSYANRVQLNPQLAVDLLQALQPVADQLPTDLGKLHTWDLVPVYLTAAECRAIRAAVTEARK